MFIAVILLGLGSTPAQAGAPAWGTVPSPNGGFGPNELFDVAVLAPNDIWAVGNFGDFVSPEPQVQHWDGVSWHVVPVPGDVTGDLIGVTAVAANDVWFVGGASSTGEAFIYHWDGTSLTAAAHPNPGSYNRFYDVTAVSANDIWAVGEFAINGGISKTLTEHWNGTSWTVVASPTTSNYTELRGVAAVGSNDVWAVGENGSVTFSIHWDGTAWTQVASPKLNNSIFNDVSATTGGEVWAVGNSSNGTLTARWSGAAWVVVPSPSPGNIFDELNGVTVLSPSNAYAVGFYDIGGVWKTLALHYDGTQWSQITSPSPDPAINLFNGVDADMVGTVWAVGRGGGTLTARLNIGAFENVPSANAGIGANVLQSISGVSPNDIWAIGSAEDDSLAQHWDGAEWTIVPTPDLSQDAPLEGVSALASNDVWAVGFIEASGGGLNSSNLIEHWNGSAWSVVPSPNPGGNFADQLHDVAVVSSNDVWAVGEYGDRTGFNQATILHWNGSTWANVPNTCGGPLSGITLISANDIWAVGEETSCHYDGTTWTPISIPSSGGVDRLDDVSAISTNDVWAVGTSVFCDGFGCHFQSYAIHWNGSQWIRTTVPGSSLGGVQAVAPNNVWAVGTNSLGTVILRWNGKSWRTVPSPEPNLGELHEITLVGRKLWSVGSVYDNGRDRLTLIVNSPSDTQGAILGDTGVSEATVSWFGPVNGTTTTDVFGKYAVAGLPAGSYTIVAAAQGCDPDIATVEILAGKTIRQNLNVDCSP